jgi:hypothetical protein
VASQYAATLGLQTSPLLYRGLWEENSVNACWTGRSIFDGEQEGYVVRIAESSPYAQDAAGFSRFEAKCVRAGHMQTDDDWLRRPIVPNLLKAIS